MPNRYSAVQKFDSLVWFFSFCEIPFYFLLFFILFFILMSNGLIPSLVETCKSQIASVPLLHLGTL